MQAADREIGTEQQPAVGGTEYGDDYNFDHFRTTHILSDVQATLEKRGIQPGEEAPDFELPLVGGESLRLYDLRDKPSLLHFGSYT
jgi:hypothetical protein